MDMTYVKDMHLQSSTQVELSPDAPFTFFCHANRRGETELRRCIGLIERRLALKPKDKLAQGCRAGLLMQSSSRSHPERLSGVYSRFAMRVQTEMLDDLRDGNRAKLLFVHGSSLTQISAGPEFDRLARIVLKQLLQEDWPEALDLSCRPEAMIALSLLEQELGDAQMSRELFLAAQNNIGRELSAWLFEDYSRLRQRQS